MHINNKSYTAVNQPVDLPDWSKQIVLVDKSARPRGHETRGVFFYYQVTDAEEDFRSASLQWSGVSFYTSSTLLKHDCSVIESYNFKC